MYAVRSNFIGALRLNMAIFMKSQNLSGIDHICDKVAWRKV